MKGAVVTGAKGFLGSQVVEELLRRGVPVTAIGSQGEEEGRQLPRSSLLTYVQMDLQMDSTGRKLRGHLELIHSSDVFFHFAWRGASGPGREDCWQQMDNLAVTLASLQLAKALGCERFVGAGSLMEREVAELVSQTETLVEPQHLYSATKLAAHHMTFPLAAQLGIQPVWGIITNLYGPGERSARFLVTTLENMMNGEPLDFTAATQWYDFLHVKDGAKAFCDLGEKGRAFTEYTIGSGDVRPLKDFILMMDEMTGKKSRLSFGTAPVRGVQLHRAAFDIEALRRDTGFQPEILFVEGVKEMLQVLGKEG